MEQPITPLKPRNWRMWIGIPASALYLLGMAWHLGVSGKNPLSLDLNALGDYLAGAFGPLAFLWLVLGYFQQGEELKQNTDALRLQAQELANTVREQRALVELATEQLHVEKTRRLEDLEARRRSSQPILKMQGVVEERSPSSITWNVYVRNVGRTCTDFTCTADHEDMSSFISCHVLDQVVPGKEWSMGLRQHGNPFSKPLTARYIDVNGEPQTQQFLARITEFEDDALALFFTKI